MIKSFKLKKIIILFNYVAIFVVSFLIFSCATTNNISHKNNTLTLTFTGDIMAHTNVTRMKDFSLIYQDILDITQNDDLTFANFETPVFDEKPYQNYPCFNAKNEYALAAINAGFDVFTLANNHSNDQGLDGLIATRDFFELCEKNNGIYAAGIRKNPQDSEYDYRVIEKNGFKILFLPVTEICNAWKYTDFFNTTKPTKLAREQFIQKVKELKEKNPCDIFVVAYHCDEPEYVAQITQKRKSFYYELLDAGVDVIWANHPHVIQEWECVRSTSDSDKTKYIMYSVGNLISGQRPKRNYDNPLEQREFTGDNIMMQIQFEKKDGKVVSSGEKVFLLTNHTDSSGNSYIKKFTPQFIETLSDDDKTYYQTRYNVMKNRIAGSVVWR